jgi:hypothetical protein
MTNGSDAERLTGPAEHPGPTVATRSRVTMRFREAAPALLGLPWSLPLEAWPGAGVTFLQLPVGESRHIVRFVSLGSEVVACKELPLRPGRREYEVMRALETKGAPAVRVVGLVERPDDDVAIVVTAYLARSLQLRRLFRRLPEAARRHRERLLDAMATLLVELHRYGVFWGDCSLANTLLLRDGQALQAHLVDAETSEIHDRLSDGQRSLDVDLAVENVAGDLLDLAIAEGRSLDEADDDLAAARSLRDRYEALWTELHRAEPVRPDERYRVEARLRRLNALGFVVEEVRLDPTGDADLQVARLRVAVGDRRFHAERLLRLTGLAAGEGQATVLLNDLAAWAGLSGSEDPGPLGDERLPASAFSPMHRAARRWMHEVFEPSVERLRDVLGTDLDPIQAYCDLLEVKWLLSEQAGQDIGDRVAAEHLADHTVPVDSAAGMAVAEEPARLGPGGEAVPLAPAIVEGGSVSSG